MERPTIGSVPYSIFRATTARRKSTLASRFRSHLIRAPTCICSGPDLLIGSGIGSHPSRKLSSESPTPNSQLPRWASRTPFRRPHLPPVLAEVRITRSAEDSPFVSWKSTTFRPDSAKSPSTQLPGKSASTASTERKTMFVHRWASFSGLEVARLVRSYLDRHFCEFLYSYACVTAPER